jgi:hypothetical protein
MFGSRNTKIYDGSFFGGLAIIAAMGILLITALIMMMSSGPGRTEELCIDYLSPGGEVHSSRPYQDRGDAWVVAFRKRGQLSNVLNYGGCVVKNRKVDIAGSQALFDSAIEKVQSDCIYARVSLAPYWARYKRWAYKYGGRDPTEAEITRRRLDCTLERARDDFVRDIRWRRTS